MIATGMGVFLMEPNDSNQRILHPARVEEQNDKTYTVSCHADVTFESGEDIFVYYEQNHEFMQQAARVSAILDDEPDPDEDASITASSPAQLLGIELIGEPVSAESRQCYRVSTVTSDLFAKVGDEDRCPLLDISATGFSIVSRKQHKTGTVVPVTLYFENEEFSGNACVQSIKELGAGRIRYGLHSIEERQLGGSLQRGQQKISMAVQRKQLRRKTGS